VQIRILILATALFLTAASSAAPAVPKVAALVGDSCSRRNFPARAFDLLIARPKQKKVDLQSPWLRIFFDFEPKSGSAFTANFDNKYLIVQLNGVGSDKLIGSVTIPRISEEKNLEGTFDLHTPDGEHITARFSAPWQKIKMLCGVNVSGPHG